MFLSINCIIPCSKVNGHGKRTVIWFQGCSINCPDCFNQNMWNSKGGTQYLIDQLVNQIDNYKKLYDINGVTISGGEPFDQVQGLSELVEQLSFHNISILCYTGYTMDKLVALNDKHVLNALSKINILIDGPFVRALKSDNLLLRGSRNQKIYYLNNSVEKPETDRQQTEIEYLFDDSGYTFITGFPKS